MAGQAASMEEKDHLDPISVAARTPTPPFVSGLSTGYPGCPDAGSSLASLRSAHYLISLPQPQEEELGVVWPKDERGPGQPGAGPTVPAPEQ